MRNDLENKKQVTKYIPCSIAGMLLCSLNRPVYASVDALSKAHMSTAINKMFQFVISISIPVAVIGLVMCVFAFFMPDEKGWQLAKKRIRNIGIALMALMLLPAVYNYAGGNSVTSGGWDPTDSGREKIIPNQTDVFDITSGPGTASTDEP